MNEIVANFHLIRPEWLWAALPVLPAGWLLWKRMRSGKAWSSVISQELLPHLLGDSQQRKVSHWPLWALLLSWLVAVLALAGPSWERLPQPVERKEDALVVLFDLSVSMATADMTPSRLVRSRQKLLDLLEQKTEGTTGLVAYAGDAHVVSPLTDDLRTIANLLPALTPDIMPVKGSRPGLAVEHAVRLLRDSGLENGQILLLTDGIHPGDSDEIARALSGTAFRLSVLGVGTEDGGPIPTGNGFLRDADGNIIIASLDRGPLQRLTSRFGGSYSDLELGDADILRILSTDLWDEDASEQLVGRSVDTWEDMGYWLALLLVPAALGAFRRGWLLCLLLVVPLAEPVHAQDWRDYFRNQDQRGQQLLEAGEPEAAAETFKNPDWAAAANYRAGEYERALEHYSQGDSADSWYNRGNSLARAGDLEAAIAAYGEALEKAPEMEDAAFNKALLEQLLQQQQQDPQQGQQQQDPQQGENDQQQQSPQQSGQQQQEQQQQQPGQENQRADSGEQSPEEQEREGQQNRGQDSGQENRQRREETQAEAGEQDGNEDAQQAALPRDPDEMEREMANEQWLRRIPDDPSGLLRRKFRYESRQRSRENPDRTRENDEVRW